MKNNQSRHTLLPTSILLHVLPGMLTGIVYYALAPVVRSFGFPTVIALVLAGAWDHMFSRCEGYRGTTVLRDTETPERFLVVNLWNSAEHRDKAVKEHEEVLSHIRTDLKAWTESVIYPGVFTVLAKATVRPRRFGCQSSKERRY